MPRAETPAEPWVVEIHGPCMGLAEGTKLAVWPGGPWRVNDVVALRTARGYLVHRLLGRAGSGRRSRWLHGGDRGDGLGVVSESEILGHVRVELPRPFPPRLGPLLLALRTHLWWEEFAGATPVLVQQSAARAWRRLRGVPPPGPPGAGSFAIPAEPAGSRHSPAQ